jgi:RNA polymerase sigma-70 factor (ECF subfamily)
MDASDAAPPLAARLFERHAPAVRRYFRRHLSGGNGADDLAQEVFVRVVRGADAYDEREREVVWIFKIARNVLVDHHRRRDRSPESAAPVEQIAPPSQSVSLDLDQALAALSSDDRDAFLLAEVGGLSYAEIAVATGSTVAAVRSRIYRTRLALRERLMPPGRVETAIIQEHEEHV